LAAVATVVVAMSCYSPTDVTITLLTDLPCSQAQTAKVYVGTFGGPTRVAVASTTSCTPAQGGLSSLGDLVFVPSHARDVTIQLEVRLATNGDPDNCYVTGPKTCIIARRTIAFIAHSSRGLPIQLDHQCIGNYCDPSAATTCVRGACEPADTSSVAYCSRSDSPRPCDELSDDGAAPSDTGVSPDAADGGGPDTDATKADASGTDADASGATDGSFVQFCDASAQCPQSQCCCPNIPATPACEQTLTCNVEGAGCR
jgi:hypothetical protein